MEETAIQPLPHVPLPKVVEANGLLFLAGEASIDWSPRAAVAGGIGVQTRKTLGNLRATRESVGSSLERVAETTVFPTNVDGFATMNQAYAEFVPSDPPVRSTSAVAALARPDLIVEIELFARP